MAMLKTNRLVHKDLLIGIELSMDKSCRNVSLGSTKAQFGGKNHHCPDGALLNTWGLCFKEVNPFSLTISMDAKTSLKLLDKTIWKVFNTKCPGTRKDFHLRFTLDKLPCFQINFQGFHLS